MNEWTSTPDHAAIDETITAKRESAPFAAIFRTQPFWVLIAILVIGLIMSVVSDVFFTERNMYNVTRNFAFFGIMALGMTAVIVTAGIDLGLHLVARLAGMQARTRIAAQMDYPR